MDDAIQPNRNLIQDCKRFLQMPWTVKVSHNQRNENKYMNLLIKMEYLLIN